MVSLICQQATVVSETEWGPVGALWHGGLLSPISCRQDSSLYDLPWAPQGRSGTAAKQGRSSQETTCSVQLLSRVQLFATPWTTARQACLSITNSRSLPKLMSIESVMPSNHLILHHPLLLLPSIFPSIRVFSNESALRIRWPKYWSFSFNMCPSNEHPELIPTRGTAEN